MRTGMHGPLGSGKPQWAVLLAGGLIGVEPRGGGCGKGYPLFAQGLQRAPRGKPRPSRAVASYARGEPTRPSLQDSDFIFNSADGVLAVDREQRIVLWNEGAERLLGHKTEAVLGRCCHEVLRARDESGRVVCQPRCADMAGALRRELVGTRDLLLRTQTGQERWLSVSTIQVPSRWRDLCVLVHLFHDVSRQKDMERFFEQLHSNVVKLCLSHEAEPPGTPLACPPPLDLSHRELEVLHLLTSGASTQTIATKLSISPATARHHIHRVLAKLGVHSRLEAVTLALRNGLI